MGIKFTNNKNQRLAAVPAQECKLCVREESTLNYLAASQAALRKVFLGLYYYQED